MKATTIKIEGELLQELEHVKPESVSLSAYVREILRTDLRRRNLSQAAVSYQEFLSANPEEQSWLREWDEADLASAPKAKRGRR
jgi:predicted CopG family antitoxin